MTLIPGDEELTKTINQINGGEKLDDRQRRLLQHDFKVYMEQYLKKHLGRLSYIRVVIWDDMLIIKGKRFLTDPEIYIVNNHAGKEVVRTARMKVARQHSIDNLPYFEKKLQAKAIHQTYNVEPENDFWIHVIVFDRTLTQEPEDNIID